MTTAAEYCARAAATIEDRDPIYGGPTEAGFRIALLWNAYLELNPVPLNSVDVMKMLLLMKIVRSDTENDRIDAIGYAACMAQAAEDEEDFDEAGYDARDDEDLDCASTDLDCGVAGCGYCGSPF